MSHLSKVHEMVAALALPRAHVPSCSFYWFPFPMPFRTTLCLSSNRNLHLDTGLDVDNDLLDDLSRGSQVNQALVDAHLVAVPGLGTLTAGRLAGLSRRLLVVFVLQGREKRTVILRVLVGRRTGPLARRSFAFALEGGQSRIRGSSMAASDVPLNELAADLLERGDLAGGEGDTDLVDLL